MSKITAPSVGIERITTAALADISNSQPDYPVLLSDGQAVAVHSQQLYPMHDMQSQMMAFADPTLTLTTCGHTTHFRENLLELQACLSRYHDNHAVTPAIALLEQLNRQQSLLHRMLHLLHKV